jgi:type IV fimbrial biogenesis protein FimT
MHKISQKMIVKQTGVTFIELLVVITIVGILARIAFPSYRNLIVQNKVVSMTSSLQASLLLARSEALKRGAQVGICRTSNPNDPEPLCDATAGGVGWGSGWIIYAQNDAVAARAVGETIISVQNQLLNSTAEGAITSNAAGQVIVFNNTGQVFTPVTFTVSAPSGYSANDKAICIVAGGRARVGPTPSC